MSKLVFLDANVFIWAYNRPDSNSAKILNLMDEGRISVIVSEKVLEEYVTPREFLESMGITPSDTEY